jgi:hypothetical protein
MNPNKFSLSAPFFRPVVLTYGLVHIVAGFVIWFMPSITGLFLNAALPADAATLVGFISALAGLGFSGAALVESKTAKLLVLKLAALGNALNFLAHLHNVARGYAPEWFGFLAAALILAVLIILFLLYRGVCNAGEVV